MTCPVCIDGLLIVEWTDAPHDFAVCLCAAGQEWRCTTNNGHTVPAQWRVWCAKHGIDPKRMFMAEQVWTRDELAAVGLVAEAAQIDRAAALLAAGRRKR